MLVDPTNFLVQYVGSKWGGVWKTTNGGDSWFLAWDQATVGVSALAMAPNDHNTVYAAARDGTLYQTTNGGNSWTSLGKPTGFGSFDSFNPVNDPVKLAVPLAGLIYMCTNKGLHALSILTPWQSVAPTAEPSLRCTDVVANPADGTIFAGFRESGVWMLQGGKWKKIKDRIADITFSDKKVYDDPAYRIAIGPTKIAVHSECFLFLNALSNLTKSNVETTWTQNTALCSQAEGIYRGYNGYALAIAISPENENRMLAGTVNAYLTTDGGATWKRTVTEETGTVRSVDFHQFTFYPPDPRARGFHQRPRTALFL